MLINGANLEPHLSGALWWEERRVLAVADLHLEKGSSFARSGRLLPPYDSRETLRRLSELIELYRPATVLALGDSFHDPAAIDRLAEADRQSLTRLTAERDWIWVSGNHDPAPPRSIGGTAMACFTLGPLVFRHEADHRGGAGEVSGHYHPKASLTVRERRITGRCFVADARRVILPAFGAYAGGLDVRDTAIRRLFGREAEVHVLGRASVVRLPLSAL